MRILSIPFTLLFACTALVAQSDAVEAKQDKPGKMAQEAEFKAKGMVKVKEVWVEKEHVADAKRGIFHHDGEVVNEYEIKEFQSGKVRHPTTGRFIAKADLDKAKDQFPLGEGKWGPKAEADEYHSSEERPWIVRSISCNVVSTLPLDTILFKIVGQVDASYRKLQPIYGGVNPPPDRRPTVVVIANHEAYRNFGDEYGGAGSAHGAFLTPDFTLHIDGSAPRLGACVWDKDWGPYYVRHATGVAVSHAMCGGETDDVPEWFHRAIGGYVERHFTEREAKFFAGQHIDKGGVKNVAAWLSGYQISGDLPQRGMNDIGYNIFQAGMLIPFAMRGGDRETTEALQKVTAAFVEGKKVAGPIKALQKVIGSKEEQLSEYLTNLVK